VSAERKTNVLIVASSLWIGGAETVIRHLAETIDRSRFNVVVYCLRQRGHIGDEMARAGIEVAGASEGAPPRTDYFTFLKLLKFIRERNIDVVHTHTAHGLVDATLCKIARPRLKVVHTFHFGNYPHTRPRIIWMERVFSRLADRLFAVGEVQRRQIRRVHGLSDRAIATMWNGVPLPAASRDGSYRDSIGAGDRVLVGTIATLIEQKGLRELMRVARTLKDAGRDVQFVIAGEGKIRKDLERLRAELGVEDVVAMPGWVTNAAQVALPAFDIFFQPSRWEAMSVVILEAMAAGKPIVATRVGENPHVIEDGVDGLLVDPRDVEGMVAALGRLAGDGALRERLGTAARAKVERLFTVDHMTRNYERVYKDVAAR
jgi:glycosyltransferase involved in cell wall biosynthesis